MVSMFVSLARRAERRKPPVWRLRIWLDLTSPLLTELGSPALSKN